MLAKPRVPEPEMDFLRLNRQRAWDLATSGRWGDGYARLLDGLERARQYPSPDVPWKYALEGHWNSAVADFCFAFAPVD